MRFVSAAFGRRAFRAGILLDGHDLPGCWRSWLERKTVSGKRSISIPTMMKHSWPWPCWPSTAVTRMQPPDFAAAPSEPPPFPGSG